MGSNVSEPQRRKSVEVRIVQAEAEGYRVAAVISIVDREEGAAGNLASYRYFSLFCASELLADAGVRRRIDALSNPSC